MERFAETEDKLRIKIKKASPELLWKEFLGMFGMCIILLWIKLLHLLRSLRQGVTEE